jgi:peptidoglycan/xylan/chitin deacetylase (PgdA/CDA1 family)
MPKRMLKRLLSSPAGWRAHEALRTPGLCALTYHRINATSDAIFPGLHVDHFRRQMRWLKDRCRILGPDEALEFVRRPASRSSAVLITFDDGYRDFHDVAFPILEELGIPCIVFVPTAFVSQEARMLWTDRIVLAARRSPARAVSLPWDRGSRFDLRHGESAHHFVAASKEHLKRLPDDERQASLAELLDELGVPHPEDLIERQMMTWDEIRATRPLASYGGHSHAHAILSRMRPDERERDLTTCRDRLREHLGIPPRFFAYPNGRAIDFDASTKECLARLGFVASFTTIPGFNGPGADPLALRRQPTGASHEADFAWLVAGLGC